MASLFPTSLDNNDSLYIAVNGLSYTLSADIDSNVTTIPVNEDTTPSPATGYLTVKGGEAIHYASKTQFSFTGCTRHDDGTAASSHKHNDQLKVGLVAAHHNSLVQAVIALETKIGTGSTGIDGSKMKAASIDGTKLIAGGHKIRAVASAKTPILAATFTKVAMAVKTYDLQGSEYDIATSRFTATVAGTYSVKAGIAFDLPSSTRRRIVLVYKSGVEYARVAEMVYSGAPGSAYEQIPIATDIDLTVGQYVEIFVWSSAADSTGYISAGANNGDVSWLTISMLP